MTEGTEKLKKDLQILEAMVAEMDDYLKGQAIFWPLQDTSFPRLTLGGYLMRQHRLTALRNILSADEQARLDDATHTFKEALVEKVVRFEKHAHDELHARLRQWSEYLRELSHLSTAAWDYYASAVETRAMIDALITELKKPPYKLDKRIMDELSAYDKALSNRWQADGFIWSPDWESAYPKSDYWWLYGGPRATG